MPARACSRIRGTGLRWDPPFAWSFNGLPVRPVGPRWRFCRSGRGRRRTVAMELVRLLVVHARQVILDGALPLIRFDEVGRAGDEVCRYGRGEYQKENNRK